MLHQGKVGQRQRGCRVVVARRDADVIAGGPAGVGHNVDNAQHDVFRGVNDVHLHGHIAGLLRCPLQALASSLAVGRGRCEARLQLRLLLVAGGKCPVYVPCTVTVEVQCLAHLLQLSHLGLFHERLQVGLDVGSCLLQPRPLCLLRGHERLQAFHLRLVAIPLACSLCIRLNDAVVHLEADLEDGAAAARAVHADRLSIRLLREA
mmetsp:Transcript_39439/g.91488  ORF Transcript_39439/g.91488 Transcript_39439/m.91488 type:complete len:206 (+) Transcript_39439:1016-1633(+)